MLWRGLFFSGVLVAARCLAADSVLPHPPIPPPELPVRQYSAWQSIQGPIARSRGEALDESIFTSSYFSPIGRLPIEPARDVLDAKTQIAPRPRLDTFKTASDRAAELDRREYELYLHSGLSDQSLAAAADAQALNTAKTQRDQALLVAQENYQAQLTQPGVDHVAANHAFVVQSKQIQARYHAQRLRILDDPPATQPTK